MPVAGDKSILIRIFSCRPNAFKVDYSGMDGYDALRVFPTQKKCSLCCLSSSDSNVVATDLDPVPGPVRIFPSGNAWLILEPADSGGGIKISDIFAGGLPHDQSLLQILSTATSLIGSSLYEIGGVCNEFDFRICRYDPCFREVRCLDIHNQSDGWESCSHLNFQFDGNRAAPYNQYIYMIGPLREGFRYDGIIHFAYVYDTNLRQGYFIDDPPPPGLSHTLARKEVIWAPLEGRGMLFSFPRINGKFYLHDPDRNCWELCENYQPMPSSCINSLSSVLNGILYVCDFDSKKDPRELYTYDSELYAYDCNQGKLLYSVSLPELCTNTRKLDDVYEDADFNPKCMVAVADSKLCFIWSWFGYLFCARVSVSVPTSGTGGSPTVEHLGVRFFPEMFVSDIINCVPVDASLGQAAKGPEDKQSKEKKTTRLKCSQKTMNPFYSTTVCMFPLSKRLLYVPLMKKVKMEPGKMMHRLSRKRQTKIDELDSRK